MPLQGIWTDPRTGTVSSAAYVVASIRADTDAQTALVTVRVYADSTSAGGKDPIFTEIISPSGAQIGQINTLILTRVYTALQSRAEFNGFSTVA